MPTPRERLLQLSARIETSLTELGSAGWMRTNRKLVALLKTQPLVGGQPYLTREVRGTASKLMQNRHRRIIAAERRGNAHPAPVAAVRGIQREGNLEAQNSFLAEAIRRVRARLLPA